MSRLARGTAVVVLSIVYTAYVFRHAWGEFFTVGLGDWIDPYFINALLENWYRSLTELSAPAPPWFFPSHRVLGFSHSLVLFAPFYAVPRLVLHPLAAYNVAVFSVIAAGSIGLYALVRRVTTVTCVEALLVTAFFVTSANVINGGTGVWTQRTSVFLLPLILLVVVAGARMRDGRGRLAVGCLAGLLATLVFTHDFYTGYLSLLIALLLGPGVLWSYRERVVTTLCETGRLHRRFLVATAAGAGLGAIVFFSLYWKAYRANPGFPEDQLNEALFVVRLSDWQDLSDAIRRWIAYDSGRSLWLALLTAVALIWPLKGVRPGERRFALWLVMLSVVVFAIPLVWHDFSLWKAVFRHLPGGAAIRDPDRIVPLYELAIAVSFAFLLARLPRRSLVRNGLAVAIAGLLVADWNRAAFDFGRPIPVFERWVSAPIAIDPSCASFFIRGASPEYMSRSGHMGALYAGDAMFVAMQRGVPTLNGYGAWSPGDWQLANPQEDNYLDHVRDLIRLRGISNVCAFDIEARTMVPFGR